ncbi:MAG: oligosaccharide flippase family protein [Bacteroidota bacterium]|nr:oligosaccharide flippase family protein [Bacteroidota bacterium]
MPNPLKKLLGQTAVYGLSSIVGRFLNYLLVPLYTNLFLPAEYGVVTDLYAYVGFLYILLTYGMETAFFRFFESDKRNGSQVFTTALSSLLFTSSLFIALILIFDQPIAEFLMYPDHPEYVRWFAVIIGVDAFIALPFAKLRSENKALKFAVFKFINIGLNISFNLFFLLLCPYLLKQNPESFVSAVYSADIGIGYIFISNLIASLATLLLFIPDFIKPKYSFSPSLLKKMLLYGSPLLFAGLAGMVNEVIDRILLKYLTVVPSGEVNPKDYIMSQIGIYGANYKLSILMTLFIQAFRYGAEPFFFSQKTEKNAKEIYGRVMKYFIIFGLFIFLGVMLYIDIAKYFINSNYWEGLKIVPILLMANLFLGIVYNLSVWYKLTDRTRFGAYIAGGGALITLLLNFLLIPVMGYLGSAWATFACYFFMMLISFLWGRKYYRINYDLKSIGLYIIVATAVWFASRFTDTNTFAKYSINTLMLIAFTGFVFYKENVIKGIKTFKKNK